jgi:hypothetical protein
MGTEPLFYYVRSYVLPCLIVMGVFLNTLSFLVMRRMRSYSTTSKYMGFLALIDSGVLIVGGCANWLFAQSYYTFSMSLLSRLSCKLISFSVYFMTDLSVFIIVIMTGERFYAVWRPVQASKMSKNKKFRLNMFGAVLLSTIVNGHFLFTHSIVNSQPVTCPNNITNQTTSTENNDLYLQKNSSSRVSENNVTAVVYDPSELKCSHAMWEIFYFKYWIYIDASIYSFVPFTLLFMFNVLIVKNLYKASKESVKLKEEGRSLVSSASTTAAYRYRSNARNQQTTRSGSRTSFVAENKSTSVSDNAGSTLACLRVEPIATARREHSSVDEVDANAKCESQRANGGTSRIFNQTRYNARITFMLIVLNVSFCVFSMPIVILQIVSYNLIQSASYSSPDETLTANSTCGESVMSVSNLTSLTDSGDSQQQNLEFVLEFMKSIAELLQYLNHSSNFFLYSFSGKTFRNETKSFLKHHYKRMVRAFGGKQPASGNRAGGIGIGSSMDSRGHRGLSNSQYNIYYNNNPTRFNESNMSFVGRKSGAERTDESFKLKKSISFEPRNSVRSTIKR